MPLPGPAPFPIQSPPEIIDRARTRSPGNDLATMPFVCGPRRRRLVVKATLSRASPCRRLRSEPSRVDRGQRRGICVWGRSTLEMVVVSGQNEFFLFAPWAQKNQHSTLSPLHLVLTKASISVLRSQACLMVLFVVDTSCSLSISVQYTMILFWCSRHVRIIQIAKFLSTKYKWE